nr:Uncharacterised protein [Klebsiella pneumoniae]
MLSPSPSAGHRRCCLCVAGGVSHHPAESVTAADVGLAIDAFSRAVEKVADA